MNTSIRADGSGKPKGDRPKGGIIAFRNDRLGGRLNAILTAMRVAKRYDIPLQILWPAHEDTSIEMQNPGDLFAADFMAETFVDQVGGMAAVRNGVDIGTTPQGMTQADFITSVRRGTRYLSNSATEQLLLPFEDKTVLEDLPELLHEMPLTQRVRGMIDKIDRTLSGVSFQSYHLRRGDIIDDSALASHNLWSNKYIPRVVYEWHMKRQLRQGRGMIVVFSDAQEEARAFAELSPRVKSFSDLIGDEELTILQRDFLELYTMSRSDCIFAPPSSAFSGIAAVIGNSRVVDIEADLSPVEQDEALDELVDRLESRPEMFLTQSDLGQNFPFIANHLAEKGQARRAQDIIMGHVERGFDRAYVYPFLSRSMLDQGDLDGIDRLLEIASRRPCYRDEHWSEIFTTAAIADLLRGRTSRALDRFHVGQWFYPINRLVAETFWYMVATGQLTSENSFPFDSGLLRKAGRIYKIDESPAFAQLMARLDNDQIQPRQYPSNIEVRDWRRLMGKKLNFNFANRQKIRLQIDALGHHFRKTPDSAALASARGALFTEVEDWPSARRHLSEALEKDPGNPLYLKRLADLQARTGAKDAGVASLAQAVELSGGTICYRTELAQACFDAGDKDGYVEIMENLRNTRTGMVEIRFLVAEYLRRSDATLPEVPAYLDDLLKIAPGSQRILTQKSKTLEQLGRFDEALDILRGLRATGRKESIIKTKVHGLYKAYAKAHDHDAAKRWRSDNGISEDYSFL